MRNRVRVWKLYSFRRGNLLVNIAYVDIETYRNHLKNKPVSVKKRGKQVIIGLRKAQALTVKCPVCIMFFQRMLNGLAEKSPFDKGKSLILKENNLSI